MVAKAIGIEEQTTPELITALNEKHVGKVEWRKWDDDVDHEQIYYGTKVITFLMFKLTTAVVYFEMGDYIDMAEQGFPGVSLVVDTLQGRRPHLLGYLKFKPQYASVEQKNKHDKHVRKQLLKAIDERFPTLQDEATIELRNTNGGWKLSVAREYYGMLADFIEELFLDRRITQIDGEPMELLDEMEKKEVDSANQQDQRDLDARKCVIFGAPTGTEGNAIKTWVIAAMRKTLTKSEFKTTLDGRQKRSFTKPNDFTDDQVSVECVDLPERTKNGKLHPASFVAFVIMPTEDWANLPRNILRLEPDESAPGAVMQKYGKNNKVNQKQKQIKGKFNKPNQSYYSSQSSFGQAGQEGVSSSAFSYGTKQSQHSQQPPSLEELEQKMNLQLNGQLSQMEDKLQAFQMESAQKQQQSMSEMDGKVTTLVDSKLNPFVNNLRRLFESMKSEMDGIATELGTAAKSIQDMAHNLANPLTKAQKKARVEELMKLPGVTEAVAVNIVKQEITNLLSLNTANKEKLTDLATCVQTGQEKVNSITDASKKRMQEIEENVKQAQAQSKTQRQLALSPPNKDKDQAMGTPPGKTPTPPGSPKKKRKQAADGSAGSSASSSPPGGQQK